MISKKFIDFKNTVSQNYRQGFSKAKKHASYISDAELATLKKSRALWEQWYKVNDVIANWLALNGNKVSYCENSICINNLIVQVQFVNSCYLECKLMKQDIELFSMRYEECNAVLIALLVERVVSWQEFFGK